MGGVTYRGLCQSVLCEIRPCDEVLCGESFHGEIGLEMLAGIGVSW